MIIFLQFRTLHYNMDELNIKVDMIDRYFPLILIGCQRDPAYQNY